MTAGLVAFLRARLDEAAERARANAGDERHQQWALHESADYNETFIVYDALWHLRDVEAKRWIVERCAAVVDDSINYDFLARNLADETLRDLAALDDDHPAYRERWKP